MKNLIVLFFMALTFSVSGYSQEGPILMGGDVPPPFPWSQQQLCAFELEDIQGDWMAVDGNRQAAFYVNVELQQTEDGTDFVFLKLYDVVPFSGEFAYLLMSEGAGSLTEDISMITAVMQVHPGVSEAGTSHLLYIYSYCSRDTGARQSVLELNFASGQSSKYIFEKVAE